MGTHVMDIELSRYQRHATRENFTMLSKATKKEIILELEEISKDIQVTIATNTLMKKEVDDLLSKLTKEEESDEEETEKDETFVNEEKESSDNKEDEESFE